MTHLHRELAPVSENAWKEIDKEAARTLRSFLAARQIVDFSGPHGWDFAAQSLGRLERVQGPVDGVEAGVRVVQPLVELRHTFSMDRADLDDIDRGRPDPDLSRVAEAAKRAAELKVLAPGGHDDGTVDSRGPHDGTTEYEPDHG